MNGDERCFGEQSRDGDAIANAELTIGLSFGGGGGRVVLVIMLFGLIFSNELSVDFP